MSKSRCSFVGLLFIVSWAVEQPGVLDLGARADARDRIFAVNGTACACLFFIRSAGIVFNKIRDRVLTDVELRVVWRAAGAMGYPFGSLVRALILTGQRLSELADAQWSEIDEGLGCLTQELLAELPRFEGGSFVFSSTWGRKPTVGHSSFKIRLDRIIATIAPVDPWQLHDLRRTVRTGLARAGVPVFDAELTSSA